MKQFAVVGNPIAHSKSPIIHRAFAEQTSISLEYNKVLSEVSEFNKTVNDFFAKGGEGLNITLPFKEQAYAMADEVEPRAKLAGAANTLFMRNGNLVADNTDGEGLVADLEFHHAKLDGSTILLIGAGGAARGALPSLLSRQPKHIYLVNRTFAKASQLVKEINDPKVSAINSDTISQLNDINIVINSTSSSVNGAVPDLPVSVIKGASYAYDMFYSSNTTSFNSWVQQHSSAKTIDGLGMLIEQAAESFKIWNGIKPNTDSVRKLLKEG